MRRWTPGRASSWTRRTGRATTRSRTWSTLSRVGSTSIVSTSSVPFPPNPVLDGSSYRVYQLPTESPNDRDRANVQNPADGLASPFGWHDTDGADGAEFTITRGNNAHAYLDQDDNEQQDFGGSPDGGAGLDFDFPIDLTEHAQFYQGRRRGEPLLHLQRVPRHPLPLRLRRGVGELPGEQLRPRGPGRRLRACEAQDGSGTNNANFSTPTEPTPGTGVPRMQMYLWPGSTTTFGLQNQVSIMGVGDFGAGWARFGPPATNAGVSGQLVLVNDGVATGPVGTVTDGCESLVGFPGRGDCRHRPCEHAPASSEQPAAGLHVPPADDERAGCRRGGGRDRQQHDGERADDGEARSRPPARPSRPSRSRRPTAPRSRLRYLRPARFGRLRAVPGSATATSRTGSSSTSTVTGSRSASPAARRSTA